MCGRRLKDGDGNCYICGHGVNTKYIKMGNIYLMVFVNVRWIYIVDIILISFDK